MQEEDAMKKLFSILMLVAMLVACTNAPAENATPEATGETSEAETEHMPEVMKTESELGITHPLRFADDIKIYDAKDVIKETKYEIPWQLDEQHYLLTGGLVAKDKFFAKTYYAEDDRAWKDENYKITSIGYYDLKKGAFVSVPDVDNPSHSSEEKFISTYLYPLDETRLLYEVQRSDATEYFAYTMADGSFEKIDRLTWSGEDWYAGAPYVAGKYLYIPMPYEDDQTRTHIYHRETLKKIKTVDLGHDLHTYRGEDAYTKGYEYGEHAWMQELHIGGETYRWDSAKDEYLLGFGFTSKPEAFYTLSQSRLSHELDEDLTETDRQENTGFVPYQVLHEMSTGKVIARMRGDFLEMTVAETWLGIWKLIAHDGLATREGYLYLPNEKAALRVTIPEPCSAFLLLPYGRYAVLKGYRDENKKMTTVYTFEPKDKAQ